MESLGLDKYVVLYYKISMSWVLGFIVCIGTGIWWSTINLNAVSIPITHLISIVTLIISNKYAQKNSIRSNFALKINIITMGIIFIANLALSVWTSIVFRVESEVLVNFILLWTISLGIIISYFCIALPIGILFWNLRSEDLAKVENIGGRVVAPVPIPLSSRQENNIHITLK